MLAHKKFEDILDAIASEAPVPGCGAAGAYVLALGIACLRKAVAVSARHRRGDRHLKTAADWLAATQQRVIEAADADTRQFARLLHASARDEDEERSDAARTLAALSAQVQAICREVIEEADCLEPFIVPVMAGDLRAARLMCDAAATIARANGEENVTLV